MNSALPSSISPLGQIFRDVLVPWVEKEGLSQLIVTSPSYQRLQAQEKALPSGVWVTPKPLLSARRAVHGPRTYGNTALVEARWRKDGLHSMRCPKLYFVISGNVALQIADYVVHCQPGHAFFIPAGVAHPDGSHLFVDETVSGANACKLLMMMPYGSGAECWLSHTQNGQHWSHRSSDESWQASHWQFSLYFQVLAEELGNDTAISRQIAKGALSALIHLMWREVQAMPLSSVARTAVQANSPRDPDPIASAQNYVRQHLGQPLSIDMVARSVYMSRRRFTDLFHQKTGQTFVQFVNECRLREAVNLLETTDWPNEVIGNFIGIKTGRLRILFQQRYGLTPGEYRRRAQQQQEKLQGKKPDSNT